MRFSKIKVVASIAAILFAVSPSAPMEATELNSVRTLGSFQCIPIAAADDFRADSQDVRIGSLAINEQLGGDKVSAALSVSYAVENRSASMLLLNIDFLFVDDADRPLAALTAAPPNMRIAAKRSEMGRDWTPVRPGMLATARSICARVFYMPFENRSNAP
jgi:hypothetical protein